MTAVHDERVSGGGDRMVNVSNASSVGDLFSEYVFPDEEKTRIAGLAANGGIASHIVKTYVVHTTTYKERFRKLETIPGFRPVSPGYNRHAIPRIIRYLGDTRHPRHKLCWCIYKDAAVAFIKKELPDLDKLLAEVPAPEDAAKIADLFKTVCANAEEFGVSSEDVKKFYEAWGVPRIENFESVLPLWFKADEVGAQKRQVARLLSEMETLKQTVRESASQIASQTDSIAHRFRLATEELERLRTNEEAVSRKLSHVLEKLALHESRTKGLEDAVSRLGETAAKASSEETWFRDLKADFDKLETGTNAALGNAVDAMKIAFRKILQDDLGAAATEFDSKISALASEIAKKREPSGASVATRYRSPLVGVLNQTPSHYKLANELDFVNAWMHHISRSRGIAISIEQALAYHRAFLANYVVISDHILAQTWIDCLGWQSFALHIAASPTWSCEEDWAQGAEHLFARESGRGPRLVVIHNYDVGLADCYLAPSLALWKLRAEARGLSKLFLIPSQQGQPPSPQVLEHAVSCSANDCPTSRPLSIKPGIRTPLPLRREVPTGVDPKIVLQWLESPTRVDYDLTAIQQSLKCRLTADLVTNFHRTTSFAGEYLDDASAIGIAMQHQVVPWVQARHGDAKIGELHALLKQLPGSVY